MKNKMSVAYLILLLFVSVPQMMADVPPGYYNRVEGTQKEQLKTAVHQIIKEAAVPKYGGNGPGYTWEGFWKADNAGDNIVLDRYSDIIRYFNGIKSVSGMHIEHSFANSWWGGIKNQAYKDLHHLYPADGIANIMKSNNPIGIVGEDIRYDNGVTLVGMSLISPDNTIKVWEPADEYKGDFARTYMYMVTCYEDYYDLWQKEGLSLLENNTYPVFKPWALDVLLQWSRNDPVSELEKNRNGVVFEIQGNRNPFIDFPHLAEHIWGEKSGEVFYTREESNEPELFLPETSSEIDFGLQPLSVPTSQRIIFRGRNLTGNLTLTLNNEVFSPSTNSFTPAEIEEGSELILTANPQTEGNYESLLTIQFDGKTEFVTIKVEFLDGIPAYEAREIVSNAHTKSFIANWMLMPDIEVYQLDVYTLENGTKKSLSGYPVEVNAGEYQVKNLKAQTTYYYQVSAADMVSNIVEVVIPKASSVFSVKNENLYFTTVPERVSNAQKVELTILEMSPPRALITVPEPFEVSEDNQQWARELQVAGISPVFYIRMEGVNEEGIYEEDAIISAEGVDDIILSLTCDVDKNKAYFEDFEAISKGSYSNSEVALPTGEWYFTQAGIYSLETDQKNRSRSVRMRHDSGTFGCIEMRHDKPNGADSLSFYAGAFSKDAAGTLSAEYSVDSGTNWIPVRGATNLTIQKEWSRYTFPIEVKGDIRVRIRKTDASSSSTRRINIDDVCMSDYSGNVDVKAMAEDCYRIYTQKGLLRIDTDRETNITIYSLQGILIHTQMLTQGETEFKLSAGAYVLNIDGKSFVIIL